MSTTTQLESVRLAITRIESGVQSTTYAGRTVTMADLKTLYAREQELMTRLANETAKAASTGGKTRIHYWQPQ